MMNPAVLASKTNIYIMFLASFLIWFMFAGLIILWFIDGKIKKEVVLHALMSAVFAWMFAEMMKSLIPSPRPFMINQTTPLTLTYLNLGNSFPSSHSAVAFALATSVWLHDKKYGYLFIIMAVLVALGRVFSNVHFVIDVVGGGMVGITLSSLIDKIHLFGLLKKRT